VRAMWGSSPFVRWTTIVSFIFLMLTAALPIWRMVPLAHERPFIALHYNIYLGVDRFGPLSHIFFLPVLGLGLWILNLIIEAVVFYRQKTLALFFAASNPILQFILCIAMILIILINL
jgi:hypothetical protein